jgi:hypothetical protein
MTLSNGDFVSEQLPDLSHLTPAVREVAMLPDEQRISYVRGDRWIGYTRAGAALQRLEELFAWPSKQRMPNLLIVGPTNNGKSMIIEKFRRQHNGEARGTRDHEVIPVVAVQMPSEPSVSRFYGMLLASLGAPTRRQSRLVELEQISLQLLREVNVKVLIIDELHNILGAKENVRRQFLNLIRFLGNELRIPIVGVGTRDAYLAIRSDPQLENRFEPMPLPVWEEGEDLLKLLSSFCSMMPLKSRSNIATEEMSKYVLSRTDRTIGEIAKLLTAATLVAIETGEEAINQKTLAQAGYKSPNERRQMYERVL